MGRVLFSAMTSIFPMSRTDSARTEKLKAVINTKVKRMKDCMKEKVDAR
jgi:hypothetical protein